MSGKHANREIEIKLRLPDLRTARRLLRNAGFKVARPRVFEFNVVFDTTRASLRKRGALLRLRQAGRECTLTYKGPSSRSKYKSRQEIEVRIPDGKSFEHILLNLGYHPVFRYEKYRTEHRADGAGLVTLDETPIGLFLELEGPPAWIDRTARRLEFSETLYITDSYGELYAKFRRGRRRRPDAMVFR